MHSQKSEARYRVLLHTSTYIRHEDEDEVGGGANAHGHYTGFPSSLNNKETSTSVSNEYIHK